MLRVILSLLLCSCAWAAPTASAVAVYHGSPAAVKTTVAGACSCKQACIGGGGACIGYVDTPDLTVSIPGAPCGQCYAISTPNASVIAVNTAECSLVCQPVNGLQVIDLSYRAFARLSDEPGPLLVTYSPVDCTLQDYGVYMQACPASSTPANNTAGSSSSSGSGIGLIVGLIVLSVVVTALILLCICWLIFRQRRRSHHLDA